MGCHFGEVNGGASKWRDILKIKTKGHEGVGKIGLGYALKLTLFGWGREAAWGSVTAELKHLAKQVHDGEITAKQFMEKWDAEFLRQKKAGCMTHAYWHVHDGIPTYKTYEAP